MGWQDDSRATNTLMSNYPHVSCWRDEISLGCLVEKKGQIIWFGDKYMMIGLCGFSIQCNKLWFLMQSKTTVWKTVKKMSIEKG